VQLICDNLRRRSSRRVRQRARARRHLAAALAGDPRAPIRRDRAGFRIVGFYGISAPKARRGNRRHPQQAIGEALKDPSWWRGLAEIGGIPSR